MADNNEYATIIGADAKLKGDLEFESAAKVLGKIQGSITANGKVYVAKGSDCKATVHAKEISVEGRIEGNVEAGDRIELQGGGVVIGDIQAARMTMAEGASINGHCRIGPNGASGGAAGAAGNGKVAATTEQKPAAESVKAKAAAR